MFDLTWEFRLALCAFTCYRLARLISYDDGPAFIFARIRLWLRGKKDKEMDDWPIEFEDEWFGKWRSWYEGVTCPYCTGVWLSIPLFFMLIYPTYLGDLFLIFMTISGIQAFLQSLSK